MKRFLLLSVPLAILALQAACTSPHAGATANSALHDYRLDLHGTAGVRVHLLLITKATDNASPERREEVVTLPAKIDFKAARCYAWLDTLPDGASGNEGDEWNVDLFRDGLTTVSCAGEIKKPNRMTQALGDL